MEIIWMTYHEFAIRDFEEIRTGQAENREGGTQTAEVFSGAIPRAVRSAESMYGFPAMRDLPFLS